MAYGFLDRLATPSVLKAQAEQGSLGFWDDRGGDRTFDRFTASEAAFIAARDSFYLATVSESGWPYVQHRGGPPGFLKLLDDTTLAFADYRGNRQYISLGNVKADDRVCLILMDYPQKARLKILAHMHVEDLAASPDLIRTLLDPAYRAKAERAFILRLETFDWNCPQHIRPRYTADEVEVAISPLRDRLKALEQENARLAAELRAHTSVAELRAHTSVAELRAHTSAADLHAHTSVAELRAHTSVAELHAHTSVAELRAHTSVAELRAHTSAAELRAHTSVAELRAHTSEESKS